MRSFFIFSSAVFVQRVLLFILFFGIIGSANGQIVPLFNEQMYRAELYNVAAIGLADDAQVYLNQRTDYLGDDVQPLTFVLGGNGPAFLNGRLVLGGQLVVRMQRYKNFVKSSETESAIRAAYRLVDTEKHKLSLGGSTAISTLRTVDRDAFFYEEINHRERLVLGVGANYQYTKDRFGLKLGMSLINLPVAYFSNENFAKNRSESLFSIISASYSIDNWKVEPIVLIRTDFRGNDFSGNVSETIADFGARIHYKEIVWFGGGARVLQYGGHFEIGVSPSGKFQNKLAIFGSVDIYSYSTTSLEFGLGYIFGKKAVKSE